MPNDIRDKNRVYDTTDKDLPKEDRLVTQALKRYRDAHLSDNENRAEAREDLRMLAGKDHWPARIAQKRKNEDRPCLVVNRLPAFADQILNEMRINKTEIKIIPKGSGATKELADLYSAIIREIEDDSDATVAYETAGESGVNNGFGYIRVDREYSTDSGFEQDIKINRVRNPLTVLFDPRAEKPDGSDARYVFISEMISRSEYEVQFPGREAPMPIQGEDTDYRFTWFEGEEMVRVAEYWVKEPDGKKELLLLENGEVVDSEDWAEYVAGLDSTEGLPEIKNRRTIRSHKIRSYVIDSSKIIEGPFDHPGQYIPIVPVYGKELDVDGEVYRRGAIRFAKDPQRMYDYFRTAATETVALAPKAPYIMEYRQIEGFEAEWQALGEKNPQYLLYRHVPDVPMPSRQVVSQTAVGEMTEASVAIDEMKATTNVYNASLGDQGREVSGRAILARTGRSDVANYTYYDNLLRALKHVGRILLEYIPAVYDTERQLLITDPVGKQHEVTVNMQAQDGSIVNDLSVGRYKVTVATGPRFTTQRQEAAQSMLDFIRVAPDAAQFIIDLVAEYQDWPGSEKIAARLRQYLGIDEEGNVQPRGPSQDQIFLEKKIEGSILNSEKKKLDIVEKRRQLENAPGEFARAGAQGAVGAMMGQEGGGNA